MAYNLRPEIKIHTDNKGWDSYLEMASEVLKKGKSKKQGDIVIAVECYPGVNIKELEDSFFPLLKATKSIFVDNYADTVKEVQEKIQDTITEDRVFGIFSHYKIKDFYKEEKLQEIKKEIKETKGNTIIYGFGTTIAIKPDVLVYADITRWEIQCRYRHEKLPNWKTDNAEEDVLRKFKRGYFFEWRVADRQKRECYHDVDFVLDTNIKQQPTMIDGISYRKALQQVAHAPFRLVPYFDASVWGGQWMKEKFGLDPEADNFGWAFDGVPEENSIILNFNGIKVNIPAINVVFQHPDELLGPKVHARFGTEFPIRFDYLDTMQGGNLSLQVHPLVEYAQDTFGIHYTQDESYYILDATEKSTVYLGVKEGINKEDLVNDLRKAEKGNYRFPDEKYINEFPVKKHDHVLIPSGTIHCSGRDTVILEISATPYIFTFKLWDWERVGLDGLPRPVHVEHGAKNILMERNTTFADQQLISRVDDAYENLSSQKGVTTEKTGLHEVEFIETQRHWFKDSVIVTTNESVNMLNLVEGKTAVVESLDGAFEPFSIHYGETFIVPESVKQYRVRNTGDTSKEVALIQAFVRNL